MKNEKRKMKNGMPLVLIGACLVLVSLTGCISLGSSSSATTAPNVTRMEIWVHNVEGPNPVFEVEAAPSAADISIGNGSVDLQDAQSILNTAISLYNSIPVDQRQEVVSGLIKVVGALAAQ